MDTLSKRRAEPVISKPRHAFQRLFLLRFCLSSENNKSQKRIANNCLFNVALANGHEGLLAVLCSFKMHGGMILLMPIVGSRCYIKSQLIIVLAVSLFTLSGTVMAAERLESNQKEATSLLDEEQVKQCTCEIEGYFEGYLKGEFKGEIEGNITSKAKSEVAENTTPKSEQINVSRFIFGIGPAIAKFDSNVRITDKSSGLSVFVDTEGTLGLPEYDTSPFFYTAFRFTENHGIGLQYMDIRRTVTYLDVDREYGDIGVRGEVSLVDDSDFYTLNYSYALHKDERSYILATFGLSMIELKLEFLAMGTIDLDDQTVVESRYSETLSQWAALPSIGMDFWWAYTPNWSLGTKISATGGSYKNVSGAAFESVIRARYRFGKHVGLVVGLHHNQADVDIDEEEASANVGYAFTGAYLGFDFRI